jgi:signal transduction histidine kinase/CheY-like chemotaxis protein
MTTVSSKDTKDVSAERTSDVEEGLAESPLPATNVDKDMKTTTNSTTKSITRYEKSHNKIKWIIIGLIACIGAGASAAFISLGILGVKNDNVEEFRQRSTELTFDIQSAAHDYELLGLWIHESCHKSFNTTEVPLEEDHAAHFGFCSRDEFKRLYDYVVKSEIKVQAIQYVPNITHAARATVEAQAKAYYEKNYPHYDYDGFKRVVPAAESGLRIKEEKELDFYMTLHYIEPVVTNEAAIDLSIYSNPKRRKAIDNAVATWKPALSDRLKLVQETDPNAFGFGLIHPGVPNYAETASVPTSFSQVIVRIPAILERASRAALVSSSVYIFDSTEKSVEPIFLGAADIRVNKNDGEVSVTSIPETRLSETSSSFRHVIEVADRCWTISVAPIDTGLDLVYIILGGLSIFAASIITVILVHTHLARVTKMNELRSEAEKDKAKVVLERELNEFIAHEVRNPLSSAIAALSFVSTASMEPMQNNETRKALKDDIDVVYTSLQFINDLLRNMLDIHRATDSQIELALSPTDVMRDVIEPVASMLFMRGANVDIITDCPNNLIILSDRMRLKQIILNLAANATKFVEQGYIRLRAEVLDGNVTLFVEDSGPGISSEKRERLFAKFQASLDQLNQGTGIGLCVCKNLSELMGADIRLDDGFESGVLGCPGTRFTMSLNQPPIDLESNDMVRDDESHARSGSPIDFASPAQELPESLSVLFVDDDTVLRKMFVRALRRVAPNWKVSEAASGETALRLIKSQTFDLLFMDQYMASIEKQLLGTETVRALRANGVESTICGLSANDKAQEFIDAGADTFMSKPFPCGQEELRAVMLQVLEEGEKRRAKATITQAKMSLDSSLEKSGLNARSA